MLAHAELNALAGLDSARRYGAHVLCTTLEPCALCIGGAIMVMVGGAASPRVTCTGAVWTSAGEPPCETPAARRRGPCDGVVGDLGELLHVAHFLWRKPDSIVVEVHRERSPRIVELAERVDLMTAARDGATLDDAIVLIV